jgi:hypothetical protein
MPDAMPASVGMATIIITYCLHQLLGTFTKGIEQWYLLFIFKWHGLWTGIENSWYHNLVSKINPVNYSEMPSDSRYLHKEGRIRIM